MKLTLIRLAFAIALALLITHGLQARGFGGAHAGGSGGGYHGGESRGGEYHGGESHSNEYHNNDYHGGESRDNFSRQAPHGNEYSGAEGAAAGHAAANRNEPQYSGAEGAAAGHAAANRNEPQYSAAEGAAAGAAAAHHNEPQYSGAEGAAAGAAAANRNSPQYSGAEGAAAGYAAGNRSNYPTASAYVALPTDAGYGMPAAAGPAAYAGYHQTEAVRSGVYAARGEAVRSAYNTPGLYDRDWHAANAGAWTAAGWTAGREWNAATWPAVGVSLGWGSVQPVSYNYGSNVTYQDNQVYYGTQPVATAADYYQQAATLAQTTAPADASADWLPLGVFAFVQKEQSDPHYVMQLAVNKSGAIGGNYTDLLSGTSVPIQGFVDKKTQRAAWTVGKNKSTVCDTGLYNLTRDESPVLVHTGKDKTQQWMLVRLKQPEQSQQ